MNNETIKQKAEAIVSKLDAIGRNYNSLDYGLPVEGVYLFKTMVNAVEHILMESAPVTESVQKCDKEAPQAEHDAVCIKCDKPGYADQWHTVGAESESGYGGDPICDECYNDLMGYNEGEEEEDITHYSKEYVEKIVGCSNARKAEILRLRESLDEMAEELEKKTQSASMWAQKAMEAGLQRNQLAAEVERLKGEREALTEKVNRVEVIDHFYGEGRVYSKWNDYLKVELSFQDEGRTLKVFLSPKPKP